MLPLEPWLAPSTELHFGSKRKLEKVSISKRSHTLARVRRAYSNIDVAKFSPLSGPQILYSCHCSDESGLQGESSCKTTTADAVVEAE